MSLTLTPMLCSKMLVPPERDENGHIPPETGWRAALENGLNAMTNAYDKGVQWSLRHQPFMLGVFFATLIATVYFFYVTPKGLLSAGRHRPDLGVDRGAAGYLL